MLPGTLFGNAYRVTATGTVVVTSANAYIIGVLFNGTGTAFANIFAGLTSTVTAAGVHLGALMAYATVANATQNQSIYFPFPAYASGGITIAMGASADPKLTLFWNPAGGA